MIAACGQQTTTTTISQPVPAPGVDPDEVEEMVVVEEPAEVDVPSEEPAEVAPAEPVAAPSPRVIEIDMTAKKWDFTPSTITVKEGSEVKLNIRSVDVTHGFRIAEFGVSETLIPGKTVTAEFTADKKGTYTFFCTVFCGSGHSGMRGQLVVE